MIIAICAPPAFLNVPETLPYFYQNRKKKQSALVILGVSACPIKHLGFSFKDSPLSEYAVNLNVKLYRQTNRFH
jgi:hypothetical protein